MSTCPTPTKIPHATKADALKTLRAMYRTGNGNPDLHAYRCACGAWHLGHDVRHFGKRIKAALRGGRRTNTTYARNRRTKR